ncbi:MAG: c-type cytochrome [Limisphaerales bacterium]
MSRRDSPPRFWLPLAIAITILAFVGCSHLPGRPTPGPEVVRPGEVLNFTTLYRQNCSGCHGVEGKGGAAVSLAGPVYLTLVDDATLRRITANGLPGTLHPAFARAAGGTLTEQQIDALVHGMRTHWANPGLLRGDSPPSYSASAPGDVKRGTEVYKTFCASCHGPGGHGGSKAGSIVNGSFLGLVSTQNLRTTVIVGVPGFGMPDWRSDVPGKPLTPQEVSDVVAWLAAQRPKFPGQAYPSNPRPATGGSQ